MIQNLPDWITAGTAVTAVVGGLFGVYTTTQSRMDVTDERLANAIVVIERLSTQDEALSIELEGMRERTIRSEVSAEYLKKGQERLETSLNTLAGEVRQVNQTIIANHNK